MSRRSVTHEIAPPARGVINMQIGPRSNFLTPTAQDLSNKPSTKGNDGFRSRKLLYTSPHSGERVNEMDERFDGVRVAPSTLRP